LISNGVTGKKEDRYMERKNVTRGGKGRITPRKGKDSSSTSFKTQLKGGTQKKKENLLFGRRGRKSLPRVSSRRNKRLFGGKGENKKKKRGIFSSFVIREREIGQAPRTKEKKTEYSNGFLCQTREKKRSKEKK